MDQIGSVVYLAVVIAAFYLFIIRPNSTRQRQHRELVESLKPGDRIVTSGGVFGTIRRTDGDSMEVEIADGVVIEMDRSAVSRRRGE